MAPPLLIAAVLAGTLAWGRVPVTSVVLDAPGAADVGELRAILGVEPGEPLSRGQVRRGVQALMASGQVEDVDVDARPEDGGVALTVRIQVASRLRTLEIEGLDGGARKTVERELSVQEGAPLHVAAFEAAVQRAQALLRADGYPGAVLDPELRFDLRHGTVAVRIEGSLGPPLLVVKLEATGVEMTPAELWRVTELKPGERLGAGVLEGARRRLGVAVRKQGWWEAMVAEPSVTSGATGATVGLAVRRGPAYRLELSGIEASKALLADALPFVNGDEPFSDAGVDVAQRRVLLFLQREGRLLAKVTAVLGDEEGERVLRVDATPGPRTPVVAVRFPGSSEAVAAKLRERIGARPGHYWRWGGEPVDEDTLEADVGSLQTTLRSEGYAEATVAAPRLVAEGGGVAVEFPVAEGIRDTVTALEVTGVPPGVPVPALPLAESKPWSEAAEAGSRAALGAALEEAGYPDATVASRHECADGSCRVVLRADPGEAAVVDRVVVAGLVRTHLSVVEKVAGLEPGRWIGPEEQLAAQRRLLALGIFQRASIHAIPGQSYGPRRGLILDLQEGPTRAVGFGLGYSNEERVRVSAVWSELNLFGRARSLSLEARVSSRERRWQINYREPARLGLLGFPTWVAVYRTDERFATYDFLRRGMWVEFGDHQRRPLRALLRYEYQIVNSNAPNDIKSQLERDRRDIAIASVTPVLEWDTRNDVFTPRRGVYASLQLKSAFKAFKADVAFEKLIAAVAGYAPAGAGVFALSARAGAIEPHTGISDTTAGCTTDNCAIPIAERFFAGGRVSQRAFPTDMLGIVGQTLKCESGGETVPTTPGCTLVPIGGAGLLLASAEWRMPLWGVLGGTVFLDGGNVWAAWRDIRVSQMRWGAGVGLRVATPVGPLRLEYGWKLRRLPGESAGELFLSFGNPF